MESGCRHSVTKTEGTMKKVFFMARIHRLPAVISACVVFSCFLSISRIQAGNYHTGGPGSTLVCQDCHTMHFSVEGGPPPRWGGASPPFKRLLLFDTINGLCLSCHDGQGDGAATAPDVMDGVGYGIVRAAGRFFTVGVVNGNGHNLGDTVDTPETPQGNAAPYVWTTDGTTGMVCTECHNPHGNSSYRNLVLRPGAFDSDLAVTDVSETALTPTSTQYDISNIRYTGSQYGLSRWCRACHTNFHCADTAGATCNPYTNLGGDADGDDGAVTTDQWLRHPTRDVTMAEACANAHVDSADSACDDATVGNWWTISSNVPVVSPTSTVPGTEAGSDNEPFCGTCHKAHGAPQPPPATRVSSLLWDDPATVDDEDGTTGIMEDLCQNCHYK